MDHPDFYPTQSATYTLGPNDDTACATEAKAYVDAMAAYAPCYTAAHAK